MAFWSRREKKKAEAPKPRYSPAASTSRVELDDELYVHVSQHRLDNGDDGIECWTFRTEGLLAHKQKELILAVPKSGYAPPDEPLHFLKSVSKFAAEGKLANIGGLTTFGPGSSMIHPEFRGVGYTQVHDMEPILQGASYGAADALAMVLLTENEIKLAGRFGLARVLARMGQAARFFPYPLWNDLQEGRQIQPEWIAASAISQFTGILTARGCLPVKMQDRVIFSISKEGSAQLSEALNKCRGGGFLAPTTDGWNQTQHCLVWMPGQSGPTAITRQKLPGGASETLAQTANAILGCFMGFLNNASDGEGAMGVEDGFVAFLGAESWDRLIAAVGSGSVFEITGVEEKMVSFGVVINEELA